MSAGADRQPATRDPVTGAHAVIALAGIALLAINLRTAVTAVPPLLDDLSADLRMSSALAGVLGSLPPVGFALAGLVGTRLLRRLPAERIAAGLLVISAAGQAARPWAPDAAAFLALTALVLLALGTGNVILPALVKAWFPDRAGLVTGVYVTCLALSATIPPLVVVHLAGAAGDWRAGLVVWALPATLVIPIWLLVGRRPRAVPAARPAGAGPVRLPLQHSRVAWGVLLVMGMNSLSTYAMFTWLPVRLTDAGASAAKAGVELALFAGIPIPAAFTLPPLVARARSSLPIVAGCVACFVIGYCGLLFVPMTVTTLWTGLAGLGSAGFPVALALIALRSRTHATAGALSGFVQGGGYTVAATGPILVGVLHGATGGWAAPFGFLGLTLVVMLIGGWMCRSERYVDDELAARVNGPGAQGGADILDG